MIKKNLFISYYNQKDMNISKNGQVAIEYIAIAGVILAILIPLFYFSFNTTNETITESQAEDAVFSLASAANEVYALSPGSKREVWVQIPGGTNSVIIQENEISLNIHIAGRVSDYVAFTKPTVIGTIPLDRGTHRIYVELLSSGIVQIGEANDTTPPVITWTYPDIMACNPVTLRANTDEPANCKLDIVDKNYSEMEISMSGSAIGHNYDLSVQSEGDHNYYVRCQDPTGNTMNTSELINYSIDYESCGEDNGSGVEDVTGPIVIEMNHTSYPTTLSNISVGGIASDILTGNSSVQGCNLKIDSGDWIALSAKDGIWDSNYEPFEYNSGPLSVGHHDIYYQCTDEWGSIGSLYQDSFTVVDVDVMLVLDRSGSMADGIVEVSNSNSVYTYSSSWDLVKSLTIPQSSDDFADLSIEVRARSYGCTVYYEARINETAIASGSRTSTSYYTYVHSLNVSNYSVPYQVDLYLKKSGSGSCRVYNRLFSLSLPPVKMDAVKESSKTFLDIAGSNLLAGLVSYSSSATTDEVLAIMDPTNRLALDTAIDALNPSGGTCIECGLEDAADELVSVRAKENATKIAILLTDGQATYGNSIDGAVYARDRNVTVYTIGFGYDVDETELLNIALLTNGEYYFAPDTETLTTIFQSLGRSFKGVSE
jgi:hypothetical protein